MPRRHKTLPPLTWLRAFEATARHLSMARAAAELNITASAISQQIKHLELHLSRKLLVRKAGGLQLAEAGMLMLPKLSAGFELLHEAVEDGMPARGRQVLMVRVPTSFASQWLVHRLDSFRAAHPGLTVQLSATSDPIEQGSTGADLEIRFGDGNWPKLQATLFLQETAFPVCSPDLVDGAVPLRRPVDLARVNILDVPGYREGWGDWLDAAGVKLDWTERRIVCDQSVIALQAAIDGKGVALGRSALVARDLQSGRLVAPFPLRLPARGGYWILSPVRPSVPRKVAAFKTWLLQEAAQP